MTGLGFTADDRYVLVQSEGAFMDYDFEIGCRRYAMATRPEDLLAIARSRARALADFLSAKPQSELQPWD